MTGKKGCFALFSVLFLASAACFVWANCLYSLDCEDLDDDLVTGDRWEHGDDNEVTYRTKEHWHASMPRLTVKVRRVGTRWNNIYFNS